jgi:hypothetical protein
MMTMVRRSFTHTNRFLMTFKVFAASPHGSRARRPLHQSPMSHSKAQTVRASGVLFQLRRSTKTPMPPAIVIRRRARVIIRRHSVSLLNLRRTVPSSGSE